MESGNEAKQVMQFKHWLMIDAKEASWIFAFPPPPFLLALTQDFPAHAKKMNSFFFFFFPPVRGRPGYEAMFPPVQ